MCVLYSSNIIHQIAPCRERESRLAVCTGRCQSNVAWKTSLNVPGFRSIDPHIHTLVLRRCEVGVLFKAIDIR